MCFVKQHQTNYLLWLTVSALYKHADCDANNPKCAICEVTHLREKRCLVLLYHSAAGKAKPLLLFLGFSFLRHIQTGLNYQVQLALSEVSPVAVSSSEVHCAEPSHYLLIRVHHLIAACEPEEPSASATLLLIASGLWVIFDLSKEMLSKEKLPFVPAR